MLVDVIDRKSALVEACQPADIAHLDEQSKQKKKKLKSKIKQLARLKRK